MKIGIVTTWFERGAAYVSRQYHDLLADKHNVYIYARGGEKFGLGNPRWDQENVTWDGSCPGPGTTVNLRRFRDWIEKNKLDVVFFNEQKWWQPVLLCAKLGVKTGAYIDYYTEASIPLHLCYDFVICNTKRHYQAFSWHPQAYYVPWGTDLDLYRPSRGGLIEEDNLVFFHSAGVAPFRKGCDLAIEAFAEVNGPARLIVHSQKPVREEFPHLKGTIDELLATGRMIIHEGTVPAPGLYHLGDVYVYPSRLDGIGLTVAEALACGMPVVTSDNAPMNEFVNERNGRLVAIERLYARPDGYYWPQCVVDKGSLKDSMQFFVDRMSEVPVLKAVARTTAEHHFDWKMNSESLAAIFEESSILAPGDKASVFKRADGADDLKTDLWGFLFKRHPIGARFFWAALRTKRASKRNAVL